MATTKDSRPAKKQHSDPNKAMIKTTTRTIYFVPYVPVKGKPKDTEAPPTATVSKKYGHIQFGKRAIRSLQMEGRFIKFFYDSAKNTIGWQIRSEAMSLGEAKVWKLVKLNKAGNASFSIVGIINSFRGLTKDNYKKLEIKKYVVTNQSILEKGQQYFYVKVQDTIDEEDE